MSISLVKGQKVNLSKEASGLNRILVGLGWDANKKLFGASFDLDASAFKLRNGKLVDDNDIICFSNKGKKNDAVYHHGDNLTGDGEGDDEQISVTLDKLDSDIDRIVFVVNIYAAKMKRQSFNDIQNAFIRLVDESNGKELYRFDISKGGVGNVAGLIFAELYKHNGEWKFNAVGEGAKESSINALAKRYR